MDDVFNRSFLNRFTVKAYVLDVRFERKFASDVLERVKKALLEREIITHQMVMSALRSTAEAENGATEESAGKISLDEKV